MTNQLFRKAATEHCQPEWFGEIILARPISFSFLTASAGAAALLVIAFLFFGDYTKRSTVTGRLVPDTGVIAIYPSQQGMITKKNAYEGKAVKKGDLLFRVSNEHHLESAGQIQAGVSRQAALREQSLREEINKTRKLQKDEALALRNKIDGLLAEKRNIGRQIDGQHIRFNLINDSVKRSAQLLSKGYISAEMFQQKQADLLDQDNRIKALERDLIALDVDLETQRSELDSLPLRQQKEISQLERLLSGAEQEWAESEGKRTVDVLAPQDGIITAVSGEISQTVNANQTLASLIPAHSKLQAHLYAPSRAVGFIRPGAQVLLRYQAFPYQKFGHALGTVSSVTRTVLVANADSGELARLNNEPVYQITVTLARQTIPAYGRAEPLQAGMLLDADILQERRKLIEWLLEPLYSVRGKL